MAQNKVIDVNIISFVKDTLGVTISREQLEAPTRVFVVPLYSAFLTKFGVKHVFHAELMTSGDDTVDSIQTSIMLTNIYRSMSYFVAKVGVVDLDYVDVADPRPVRTTRVIKGLCVVLYYLLLVRISDDPMFEGLKDSLTKSESAAKEKVIDLLANKSEKQTFPQMMIEWAESYTKRRRAEHHIEEELRSLKIMYVKQGLKLREIDVEKHKLLDKKPIKSAEQIQTNTKKRETKAKRNHQKLEKLYKRLMLSADRLIEASQWLTPSAVKLSQELKDIECIGWECETLSVNDSMLCSLEDKIKRLKDAMKTQEISGQTLRKNMMADDKLFEQRIQTMRQIDDEMNNLEMKAKNETELEKGYEIDRQAMICRLTELCEQQREAREQLESVWKLYMTAVNEINDLIR